MTNNSPTIEQLVEHFGEQHRRLITSSIDFLEKTEPTWGLDQPIERFEFIASLLERRVSK